ncbi:MAG: M20/M25/M40 family metallo-hydrolase [Myxococcota bacterium]|nr:M20/M25/M40 family metallo-hydrolase [Myxococcota bacterium]
MGYARAEGLEARVVPTPGRSSKGRAAAWAIHPGKGTEAPIILLSHLDVVPADPSQWTVPPLAGVTGGGFVVGRGALDAKGIAVVHLLTLLELERRDIELDRDVIFLSVPDEETGGRRGAASITRDRPELLRGAEYVLAEGGAIQPGRGGTPDVWRVTFTEKSPCWLRLRTTGEPGHGASAPRSAAVPRLLRALERIMRYQPEVRVAPEVAQMFAAIAPLVPVADRANFRDLAFALDTDPEFRERFLSARGQASLVRDTLTITVLEGSPSTNIVPATALAEIDARLIPGGSCPALVDELRRRVSDPGVEFEVLLSFRAGRSPVETPLVDSIRRVAARRDPTAFVLPQVNTGFTDAHYFRDRGMKVYGFVPRWLRPIDTRGIHGENERISIDNLELGIEVMVEILQDLAEL